MNVVRVVAFLVGLMSGFCVSAQTEACRVVDSGLQGSYKGGCVGGLASGFGAAQGTEAYQGEFLAGRAHGRGTLRTREGDQYVGEFSEGQPSGGGVYVWSESGPRSGERYEGQFRGGLADGEGTMTWSNGERHTGQWRLGQPEAPLTASMIKRVRARAERAAAVGTPDAKVCRRVTVGIATRYWISGRVRGLARERLQVKLDGPLPAVLTLNGVLLAPDQVVEDDYLAWIPCR